VQKADVAPALDFESCLDQIWEQLIAAPPSRGRSMTTVKIGTARILMSSWEVTAFVTADGPSAEDLRRAVVARALVTSATEAAKQTGNASDLDRALSVARIEVSRLQERVDVAKQAKDTEAAVNLGISTKRLLSALDEAEKL
jgi:thiamine biosynthesis protein ThiC